MSEQESADQTEEAGSDESEGEYYMTLSLNVLNHLGLNLYSNVPAVLAEVVANSWDADAKIVSVDIDPEEKRIEITDDGHGMDKDDINNRYLHVGYRRREDGDRPNRTPKHDRKVFGRKGIGKLSLFSIARTVDVYTVKDGERNSFRMEVEEIKKAISEEKEEQSSGEEKAGRYEPKVLDDFPDDLTEGTQIVLTDLKKEVYTAAEALRKRLARRFSIIGPSHNFEVEVNNEPVRVTDRDYFHKLQFIWTYGDGENYGDNGKSYEDYCTSLAEPAMNRDQQTKNGFKIEGWIGTVEQPKDLEESYGKQKDDLNKITLLVRGKMAKENLLDDFNESRLYTKYLVGEIRADFLDLDDEPDIATSDREGIVKDDDRYRELQDFLNTELNHIRREWSELRSNQGVEKAKEIDVIDDWYKRLDNDEKRRRAKNLFGKINQITTDNEEEKRQLFKYGVLAFERLRYKENLDKLEEIGPDDLEAIDEIFVDLNDIEATLYYQIVRQRLEVIDELDKAIKEDYKEKVLQKHLFENLWLLDPSWERATDSKYKESTISKQFDDDLPDDLTDDEKKGRIDIKYRLTTGQHIIIELKRPGRIVSTSELMGQGRKYRRTLKKILKDRNRGNEPVEVVFVVGRDLRDWYDEESETKSKKSLKQSNMRVLKYQTLLDNAEDSYEKYLEKREELGEIASIIDRIETEELS